MSSPLTVETPPGEPIVIMKRSFMAPRALVWKAFTRPEHVANWWGPARYGTIRIVKLDLRPGGEWRYEQTGPDGNTIAFFGTYREVNEPEKLVNTFGVEAMFDPESCVETHSFVEDGALTHYTSFTRLDSVESRDGMVASGMETGARESMDQLEALIETLKQQGSAS